MLSSPSYTLILNSLQEPAFIVDLAGKVSDMNRAAQELIHSLPLQVQDMHLSAWFPQVEDLQAGLKSQEPFERGVQLQEKSGQKAYTLVSAPLSSTENGFRGHLVRFLSPSAGKQPQKNLKLSPEQADLQLRYLREVAARQYAEELLQKERSLLQSLIDSTPDLIFYKDLNSVYLGCNATFLAFSGLSREDLLSGRTDASLYPSDLAKRFLESDHQALVSGRPVSYENWTTNPIGESVLLETQKTPYYGPNGELLGIIGISRDITHHRLAEENLQKANVEYQQLVSSISSILISLSPEVTVTQWNPSAARVFGIPAEAALGRLLSELEVEWDWVEIGGGIEDCRAALHTVYPDPVRFRRLDGSEGFLGINISPILDQAGSLAGFILLSADITLRRLEEVRYAQSQKLESIGRLAAGIAHEINTPIQYIGDNTLFLQEHVQRLVQALARYRDLLAEVRSGGIDPEQATALEQEIQELDLEYLCDEMPLSIQQSLEGIHRVSEIVRALKEFSHPGLHQKIPLDLNKALRDTLAVARNEWKYVAELVLDLDPELPLIMGLPGELNQAFLNVIVNAAQAIKETAQPDSGPAGLIGITTRQDGAWVEVRISDTGPGIPEEIRDHIFEPFFTTKKIGQGSGQGLAIAYDVIERKHGGRLSFESQPGHGTTFLIRLPVDSAVRGMEQVL